MQCGKIIEKLEQISPKKYACEWDNVGLLVGRREKEIHRIMIALDASKEVVALAVQENIDLLITHHPMIFSSLKQINEEQFTAEKVLTLAENEICYYAMHTNFDVAGGMAELAAGAQYLNLSDTSPIVYGDDADIGMGRYGTLPKPMTAAETVSYVKEKFNIPFVMLYQKKGDADRIYDRIAVMPGSGKSEIHAVKKNGYSLYLTGDFSHHEGIDAIDMGLCVIDATHYGLEHIFISFIREFLIKICTSETIEVIEADIGCPMEVI